jgi:chromosome segregation ATPase
LHLDKVKADVAAIKAALAEKAGPSETSLDPELNHSKKELHKFKAHLLGLEAGSRSALKASQDALRKNMEWLVREESSMKDERSALGAAEKALDDEYALFSPEEAVKMSEVKKRSEAVSVLVKKLALDKDRLKSLTDPKAKKTEQQRLNKEEEAIKAEEEAVAKISREVKARQDEFARQRLVLKERRKASCSSTSIVCAKSRSVQESASRSSRRSRSFRSSYSCGGRPSPIRSIAE